MSRGVPQTSEARRAGLLVVAADARQRDQLISALGHSEWLVRGAQDVSSGLDAAQDGTPDVIVLDAAAGGDSVGLSGLRKRVCVGDGPGTKILVIAEEGESGHSSGLPADADDFLLKPVRAAELVTRVRILLARRHEVSPPSDWQERLAGQAVALLSLADLISALSVSDTLEGVLGHVITCAAGLGRSREVAILLPDTGRQELVVAAVSEGHKHLRRGARLSLDGTVVGRVFATGGPVVCGPGIGEVGDGDEQWPGAGGFACVPLVATGDGGVPECVGVLGLSGRCGGAEYTLTDLEYLQMVGHFAAAAVRGFVVRYWRDQMRDSLTLALVSLTELRDNDTGRHLGRVTAFSVLLAEELRDRFGVCEIDETFVRELRRAVPLHDIGKVAIPDHILLKPGRLTPEEMDLMKTHTSIGADTVRSVRTRLPDSTFAQMAEDIARYHHEWYDGAGYPEGRAGECIPLAARIVALADVYDALTTKRVYKEAQPHDEAAAIIAGLFGKQFDPRVGQAFLNRQGQFAHYAELLTDDGGSDTPGGSECKFEAHLLGVMPSFLQECAGVSQ